MTARVDIDQTAGDLTLHTGRAGIGSRVGHDLTLRVATWSATATLDETGGVSGIRLVAALPSLQVVRGDGGVKPVSEKDKETILSNAGETLKSADHPEVVFEAQGLAMSAGQQALVGELSLAGVTRPQSVDVVVDRSGSVTRVQARAEVVQSDYGIKPYSGMLGALRVRDMVEVRADVSLAAPEVP